MVAEKRLENERRNSSEIGNCGSLHVHGFILSLIVWTPVIIRPEPRAVECAAVKRAIFQDALSQGCR